MVISTVGHDFISLIDKTPGHNGSILLYLRYVLSIGIGKCFPEGNCLGGNDMFEGTSLSTRKNSQIQKIDIILISPFGVVKPQGFGKSIPIMINRPSAPAGFYGWWWSQYDNAEKDDSTILWQ